jgi:ABC-type sugar transport system ATPase subunit
LSRIRFEGIGKSYRRQAALDDVTVEVQAERLTVLYGPSRAGKSVLMRLLVGLEAPDRGRILFDETDITAQPAAARTIGYVPQSFALFPHMSAFDNIAYPLLLQSVKGAEIRARVGQVAEMLRITPLLDKYPNQLSGGEKQRAAIARGTLKNASIFALDDPLAGLDFKLRESLMDDLKDLRAELGATFLYATSDPLEALAVAERLVVLDAGRMMETGEVESIYHSPSRLRTAELVGYPRCNVLRGQLEETTCTTALARFALAVAPQPARDVVIAIRPEHIAFTPNGGAPRHAIRGTGVIRLMEHLGAESIVHLDVPDGRLVTTPPTRSVLALDIGSPFPFAILPEAITVFDAGSGARIGSGMGVGGHA